MSLLSLPTAPFISSKATTTQVILAKASKAQGGGGYRWACRKKDIHPEFHETAKVYCNGELVMTTGGTQEEYKIDVWSGNHPFYLGNRSAMINDDQVEKFRKKFGQLENFMEIPNLKYGEINLPSSKKKPAGKGKGKK